MAKNGSEMKAAVDFASAGNAAGLSEILEAHPDIARAPQVLNAAALNGKADCAALLLNAGADPDLEVPSHEKYRPLHRAIEHKGVKQNPGHLETARVLLAGGADPSKRATWRGLTALQVAAMMGDLAFIESLRNVTGEIDFFTAIMLADLEVVRMLLGEWPIRAVAKEENGMTPLHFAALSGLRDTESQTRLAEITNLLLAGGADPNSKEKIGPYEGLPPLHFTAQGDNFAVARALLEGGADPNGAFGSCLWHDSFALAELFLSYGADVNGFDAPGTPLIHSRLHWNLPKVAMWLLEHGADVHSLDTKWNTPLHLAAARGSNPKVIDALLERGARLAARNAAGETPIQCAESKGKTKTVAQLSQWARAV